MSQNELNKNVQKLVDIESIKKLQLEYIYGLNSLQWDTMLDCFTETAVTDLWDHGICEGKAQIESQFKKELANIVKPRDCHFIGQPLIEVNGDSAKGKWMMMIFFPEGERRFVKGKYDAEYLRVDNQWKIDRLVFTCPWPPLD